MTIFTQGDYKLVRRAMEHLPEEQKNVARCKFWESMTDRQIALILDMSIQRVENQLENAMQAIKIFCLAHPNFSRNTNIKLEKLSA